MKRLFALSITLVLLTSAACAKGNQNRAGNTAGITFTVSLSEDITAVDPGFAWNFVTNPVVNQITEGLVTLDTNSNIVPQLAKSWRQTDDLTYIYEVRDDIVFSDGTPMTMDDVLFSLKRIQDPEYGTYFSWLYEDVASFTQSAAWQLTIKLTKPSAVFKYYPTTAGGRIISKAYFDKHAQDFGTAQGGILATGPFVYQSWTSGQEIVLKRNPNYWNKQAAAANIIDTIVFKIIPEDTTRVIAMRDGSVDFTVNPPLDMIDDLASDRNLTLTSVDTYSLTYLAFNTQRAPFDDVNVRKAVYHALNLPEFHRNIIKTAGSPGTVLPFGTTLYGDNAAKWRDYLSTGPSYGYDLTKARSYLAQSAYPDGFNCDVIISASSMVNARALFLQNALNALNIKVSIRQMTGEEQDTYQSGGVFDANGKRDYDMLFGGWEADYPDLNGSIEIMYASSQAGENGYNAAAYSKPEVDALIEAQRSTVDSAKRFEIQKQMMDIVINDVAYIIFDYPTKQSVLNRKYSGVAINPAWLWVLPMQNVRRSGN
jgi:peptide/nickel transport system substrate-binding protein